jgi:hypothetical protein
MGMLLSIPLMLVGIGFIVWAMRTKRTQHT